MMIDQNLPIKKFFYKLKSIQKPITAKTVKTVMVLYFLMKSLKAGQQAALYPKKHQSPIRSMKIITVIVISLALYWAKSGMSIPKLSPPFAIASPAVVRRNEDLSFASSSFFFPYLSSIMVLKAISIGNTPNSLAFSSIIRERPEAPNMLSAKRMDDPRYWPITMLHLSFRASVCAKRNIRRKISSIFVLMKVAIAVKIVVAMNWSSSFSQAEFIMHAFLFQ